MPKIVVIELVWFVSRQVDYEESNMKAHTKIAIAIGGIVGASSSIFTIIDTPSVSNILGGFVFSIMLGLGAFLIVFFFGEFLGRITGRR